MQVANIANTDQTPIYFDMVGNYTLEQIGKKGPVKVTTGGKEKDRFTVQLTALADGTKLPPLIIFKGSGYHWCTPPRNTNPQKGTIWNEIFRRLPDAEGVHYPSKRAALIITSPSAMSCEKCTNYFINFIWRWRKGANRPPSILVWDSFSAHGTDSVKQNVETTNTQTHVIDGGLTPVLQPMDKLINKASNPLYRVPYTILQLVLRFSSSIFAICTTTTA